MSAATRTDEDRRDEVDEYGNPWYTELEVSLCVGGGGGGGEEGRGQGGGQLQGFKPRLCGAERQEGGGGREWQPLVHSAAGWGGRAARGGWEGGGVPDRG